MNVKKQKLISLILILFFIFNCGGGERKKIYKKFDTIEISEQKNNNNSVSAYEGGEGFSVIAKRLGWQTNNSPIIYGDKNAIKGDTLHFLADEVFPNTIRAFGKETRSQLNNVIEDLVYENLLTLNAETFELETKLATHWKVDNDSLTFLFRINPKARFSDGREVTAQDVVATYNILVDEVYKVIKKII